MKECDNTINEICSKRNKETEEEADLIEKASKINKDRNEQRNKKEENEKKVKDKKDKVDIAKKYNLELLDKHAREYRAAEDSLRHMGVLKNLLHELEEETGLLQHHMHSTKAGEDHLSEQERAMHAELARLNKVAVDANN